MSATESRSEKIEKAAGAVMATLDRYNQRDSRSAFDWDGVSALRAAPALPADAPAQPAPEGAGEAVAWQNVEAALREWEGRVVIRAKMEGAKEDGIAYAREQESRALMVALGAIHAYAAHPTPRAEAASAEAVRVVAALLDREYGHAVKFGHEGAALEVLAALRLTAPASAEAVATEAADLLAEMDAAWPPCQPPPHPRSFQGRFQARVRAVAHALRGGGA